MTDKKKAFEPRRDPGQATAEKGLVILDGPDGVAVTMTAKAAMLTADSLYAAAREAESNMERDGHSE